MPVTTFFLLGIGFAVRDCPYGDHRRLPVIGAGRRWTSNDAGKTTRSFSNGSLNHNDKCGES
jgi:hypothetical protein